MFINHTKPPFRGKGNVWRVLALAMMMLLLAVGGGGLVFGQPTQPSNTSTTTSSPVLFDQDTNQANEPAPLLASGSTPQFQEFQSIPTSGAHDWEYFTIGSDHYLAVANRRDGSIYNVDSTIYQWDGLNFVEHQSIPTVGTRSWEFFTIDSEHYLAVANSYDGSTDNIDSKIYKWNEISTNFVEFQTISTYAANDWKFFTIDSNDYLAVANETNQSQVYQWNGTSFVQFQSIPTDGAFEWEFFTIDSDYYLVVAAHYGSSGHNVISKIYQWNGTSFIEYQSISTFGALDWEFFTLEGNSYLIVANHANNEIPDTESTLYRWNGTSFVEYQSIPTWEAYDWEFFTMGGNSYLAMASYHNGSTHNTESTLYRWDGTYFLEYQAIPTHGARDWEFFTIDSQHYLALANHYNGSTFNIDSKIYKANHLLSLHALAFDNDPTSPSNLSPLFRETMDGIVAGSEGHPEKTAVVLVDQDGEDDTRIYVVQDGMVTPIDGLPDSGGVLDGALDEYQMTDGATLGGFIKWARQEYKTAGTKTTFSYVGHGTFLAPAVDLGEMMSDNRSSLGGSDLFPLTEINVKASFTDKSPEYALITPHALQVALEVGTDGGNNPLEVLDVVHCFSGSLEELYDVSNPSGTPYASTMVASPNYSYFAPEMLGAALAGLDASATAAEMASSIMSAYDAAVDEADQADGDAEVEHPRTTVVVDSSQLPALKTRIDEMAWYLDQAFDSQPIETKDKLFAAYNAAGTYYDSDYCPPQAWELGTPDGLVDSGAFLRAIAQQNISSGVTLRALQAAALVESAVIERTVRNGVPWFAEPLTPNWTFDAPNASGLALYADLQGMADGDTRIVSWHARFYTDNTSIGEPNDNPYPYLFVQDGFEEQTWADVFERYWEVKRQDEGLTVQSVGCLPDFPPVVQEGELAAEQVIFPVPGTIHAGYPTKLAVGVSTEEIATNPLITFNAYDSQDTLVYSNTVGAGYLVAGTHYVEASTPWTPASSGIFTLEMLVDADNSFLETNESDNITTTLDAAFADTPFEMTATTLDNRQWFDTQTIDLQISADEPIDTLIVQIYEYLPAGGEPNTQLPAKTHELYFTPSTLPNFSFELPSDVAAGSITLHLWGISQSGELNQEVAIIEFNYNPMSTLDMESDYFILNAAGGDNLQFTLNVTAGEAKLYVWEPGNPWTAEMVNVQAGETDAITFNAARSGDYLIAVEGQAIGTEYTISSQQNRAPSTGGNQLTVQKRQPTFTAPIPQAPDEWQGTTLLYLPMIAMPD